MSRSTNAISRRELLAGAGAGAAALFLEQSGVQAQATPNKTVVFSHTTVVTVDAVHDDVALAVRGDTIAAIGPTDVVTRTYPTAEIYDARGKALFPGLVNCHAHLAATLERCFNEDFGFPNSARLAVRPASLLQGEEATLMVTIGALEAIRTGTTTLVENTGGISRSAAALAQTGLRMVFAESVRDSENVAGPMSPEGLAKSETPRFSPKLRDEGIIYTAHHDHLGIGRPDERGDAIYNGAIDNASGCAILLEMARVWANTKPAPKRSMYFASVAAEEQGLLGSAYLGQHPPIPAGRIALNLNYDAIPELGRVRDVVLNGAERTTFYPSAENVTRQMDLTIVPDPEPEQGHYYRSDHFSLGKVGIPAFSVEPGHDVVGKGKAWGDQMSADYREHRYHQPSDEFNPNWDWSEGVQMAQLGYWLGWDAANAATLPNWKPGDEFRAVRDRSLH